MKKSTKPMTRGQYVNMKRQRVFDNVLCGCDCLSMYYGGGILHNVKCENCPIHSCYYEHARMTNHIVEEEMLCPVPMDFAYLIKPKQAKD